MKSYAHYITPSLATKRQRGARLHTHLQAPERGQSVCAAHMDQTSGLHALDRQAASISSPPALPQAHDMHQRRHPQPHTFHSVFAHSAMTACAGAAGDRKASPRSSAPCWRFPRATHRHGVSPGSPYTKLPRQAADGLACRLNEMPESSLAQELPTDERVDSHHERHLRCLNSVRRGSSRRSPHITFKRQFQLICAHTAAGVRETRGT
jgi:hypothetical protein